MKALLTAVAALILAACNASPVASDDDNAAVAREEQQAKASQVLVADPKDVVLDSQTPLLNWHVSWPKEVSAYPSLVANIRGPAEKAQVDYEKQAAEDKAEREKDGFPWPAAYEYSVDVKVAGETPRLLSLAREWMEFTGGAHPNHGTEAILWDRQGWRELKIGDLFSGGESAFSALAAPDYCSELDKERKKRRMGMELGGADDPFWACPKFEDLSIIPQGEAQKPFTTILFHADPYTAGPYSESDYDIRLPVTAAMIAAMKPEYRSSFVAQPQ